MAASAASRALQSVRQRVATNLWPVVPSDSGDTNQSNGGTMMPGSSKAWRSLPDTPSGIMPVRVAPPDNSAFTVTPVSTSSRAQMEVSYSRAALEGP